MSNLKRIRPPQRERTHVVWQRILDAGVAILESDGEAGFTIAAICRRANVNPPTIYARAPTKQDLFFAVFEHGFESVRRDTEDLLRHAGPGYAPAGVIREGVAAVALVTLRHEAFLRAIVRCAEVDSEVSLRTRESRAITAQRFRQHILQVGEGLRVTEPDRIDAGFRIVFAALLTRVTTPSSLDLGEPISDDDFIADLQEIAESYFLKP